FGAPGRNSQPNRPPLPGHQAGAAPSSHGSGTFAPGTSGFHEPAPSPAPKRDPIETQTPQLLPAAPKTRTYRHGEPLMGRCWQLGEPLRMSSEEVHRLPGGSAPPDPEAPWHLAVPILRPGSLASLHPSAEVIGVISVYNRDALWPFSERDAELLMLHAD